VDDVLDTILDTALRLLNWPVIGPQLDTVEVVATVLRTSDPDEPMRVGIGRVLAERARAKVEGTPAGIAEARVEVRDEGECEDLDGRRVRSFGSDQRCYRLTLHVVM